MPRPKVLVFTKFFWPEGGGGELATHLIVKDIISKFFYVTVISSTRKPETDVLKKCRFIYWPMLKTRFKLFEWSKLLLNAQNIVKFIKEADAVYIPSHTLLPLAVIIKKIKPDVKVILHLHNYQPISFTSIYIYNLKPKLAREAIIEYLENRCILRAIATEFMSPTNIINKIAIRYSDAVICVSRAEFRILKQFIRNIDKKAYVIYNPLPELPNIEKNLNNTPLFIYAGGGSYIKGFHILLRTLPRILGKLDLSLYIIAGRRLSKLAFKVLKRISNTYSGKLTVLGRLRYERYLELHRKAWALLFPSISEEPLPYVVVESMAVGTIPIASRVGGIPEIIKGSSAEKYLFTPGNVNEFIDRIERIATFSREEIIEIGKQLREHISRKLNIYEIRRGLLKAFYRVLI